MSKEEELARFISDIADKLTEENIWIDSDAYEDFDNFFSIDDQKTLFFWFGKANPDYNSADGGEFEDSIGNVKIKEFLAENCHQ
ncbi:MAG: hypothetical protein WBF90_25935 [Rivularia sp. (in: cyanobacteria)]